MKVLIIGGGIGGLTLALMLHARGIRPRIVEAAVEVKPLGVGINVQPSAVAELTILGLLERLDATGVRTAEVGYYNKFGQHIWSEPRGVDAGYAVPQFSIHRGRLQMLLFDAVRERLGADAIETGMEAVAVEPDAGRVTLRSRADGTTRTEQADAIVAADGIHSAVRRARSRIRIALKVSWSARNPRQDRQLAAIQSRTFCGKSRRHPRGGGCELLVFTSSLLDRGPFQHRDHFLVVNPPAHSERGSRSGAPDGNRSFLW